MVGTSSYLGRRFLRWTAGVPAASADRGRASLCTVRNRSGLTERYLTGPLGLRVVDRIVDRARRTVGALCALCAFRRAFCAATALRAGRRGDGKRPMVRRRSTAGFRNGTAGGTLVDGVVNFWVRPQCRLAGAGSAAGCVHPFAHLLQRVRAEAAAVSDLF